MNVAPISITRTNNGYFRKNEQPPIDTIVNKEYYLSFQAKTVKIPEETKNMLEKIATAGLATVGTVASAVISRKETIPKQEKLDYAPPEEFRKYGMIVTDVDKEDGLYTIDKLRYLQITDAQNKFIKEHFHQIKKIEGNANFNNLDITSLENLERIGRDAYFKDSKITSLGNLKEIGRYADFYESDLTSLGKLERIGGDADFRFSNITSLGNLKEIGGNVHFRCSNITSLDNLEKIGGNAYFYKSNITSLGNLKEIGGDADFEGLNITSLGKLERIGGDAYVNDCSLNRDSLRSVVNGYIEELSL